MCDVFFFEAFDEEAAALLRFLPPEICAGMTWQTIQEWGQHPPPARLISVRTQSDLPDAWAPSIDGILTRSTGYDHVVSFRDRTRADFACGYLPLYCNRAVAEQAAMLWMCLLRRLPVQVRQFREFKRDGLTGRECEAKTLLVVGVGNIGYQVTRIGQGLGMRVLGVDLTEKHEAVTYVDVDDALPEADVIVSAMNLTPDNAGYFSPERLQRVRRGCVFVNIARGELAHTTVLLPLLKSGQLGGVALDVYAAEIALAGVLRDGEASDNPEVTATLALAEHPNAILTPHNAFNTRESVERKAEQSVEQVRTFLSCGAFLWPVP